MKKSSSFFFAIILMVIAVVFIFSSFEPLTVSHHTIDGWRFLSIPHPWYYNLTGEDDIWLIRLLGTALLGVGAFLGFESVIKLIKLK